MSRLEHFFRYAESHRVIVCLAGGIMIALIAWGDWRLPTMSIGFLYLFPILIAAAALNGVQIVLLAALCAFLREVFDPLQWSQGAYGRILVSGAGFAMTGFFITGLNQRRLLLQSHLAALEKEVRRRKDAESQVRTLIETSPLAILTLDTAGCVLLANRSASRLLDFGEGHLQGVDVTPYLPILPRMFHSRPSGSVRTHVEGTARRRNGEVFLASVWVSTYETSAGPALAAVIWDASENLRDREGAGLDSMLATSRVLIGAISHEVRNLASAASNSYAALASLDGVGDSEPYEALGSLIRALESIAHSGLRMASQRQPAVADLRTVLDEARVVIEPLLREADFAVEWNMAENLPLVQADQHSLLQVFVNLARNIQVHGVDWKDRRVFITAQLENDLATVRFRDFGPGIAEPGKLFQAFQPGSQSAGLGLFISRAILRSHGGNLRYESDGPGSCFLVELWPYEKAVEVR